MSVQSNREQIRLASEGRRGTAAAGAVATPWRTAYRRLGAAETRGLLGDPDPETRLKIIDHLDRNCLAFIAHSPFCCMATADASGAADCTPRGDYPGFVRALDERTLVIPDRLGNKLGDSFSNIAENPHVGLLFFVPGVVETLRVNGRAYITDDEDLRTMLEQDDVRPELATLVEVDEAYLHCGRSLLRSRLWEEDMRDLAGEIPSPGTFWADAAATEGLDAERLDRLFDDGYQELY
ncbi:MSMEG_1061 family FMN-dependent PPOX-type flavoprotein [Actinomadura chibensis]|uniref:Pyridoxamine 5'-phosphate oxidase family protein n=1 Tax=Actinomadura chibensis TaxID=392828 RepID=A0A5D0NY08_9ACTN|nr:MSMEG_1061 family FMN-dependent PPOX-type flavoprotein [Actinomadura chibensis]TYB48901.1 pyridoxamine 5'-phosphate oxidase family protein [Actinomadura chibensis]